MKQPVCLITEHVLNGLSLQWRTDIKKEDGKALAPRVIMKR